MQADSNQNISISPAVSHSSALNAEQLKTYKTFTMIVYGAYALGLVLGGVPTIIGLIMAYVRRAEYAGTIYGLHLRFLIRTFWYGALWVLVGAILAMAYIGFVVVAVVGIWYIYRIVRGFLCLYDDKAPW
ncbi:hypothetical protein KVP09_05615 [Alcaligenaceae bacterium CGII-47]|nr:hypothetical protein [Alcaligenaceae bacterium CGII-47]